MSKDEYDEAVKKHLAAGISPKCVYGARKYVCTPEEWAAHREYYRQYSRRPVSKKARKIYEARWLSKKGTQR